MYRGCVYKHTIHMQKHPDPEQLPVGHTWAIQIFDPSVIQTRDI